MDVAALFETFLVGSGVYALLKVRGLTQRRTNLRHLWLPGESIVKHQLRDKLPGIRVPVDSFLPSTDAADSIVCERVPTGRGPLNYIPREGSMPMRKSQRQRATS